MARINIEDGIFRDHRFLTLAIKLGDPDRALGVLVRAWCLAQKWYAKSEDRRIPLEDWKKQLLPETLFEVGLAESNGRSVRVAGADDHFTWLIQRIEAGQRSAESRRKSHGTAQPVRTTVRETPNDRRTAPNGSRTSISISSSFSDSSSVSDSGSLPEQAGAPDLLGLWNSNCGRLPKAAAMNKSRTAKWSARWKERPELPYWESVVRRMAESRFCNGDSSSGWVASVDFFLRAETHLKVSEGNYDNNRRSRGPANADLAEMVRKGEL